MVLTSSPSLGGAGAAAAALFSSSFFPFFVPQPHLKTSLPSPSRGISLTDVERSLAEALRRPSALAAGVEEARTAASTEEGEEVEEVETSVVGFGFEKPAKVSTARRTSSTPTKPRHRASLDDDDEASMTVAASMSREAKRRRT